MAMHIYAFGSVCRGELDHGSDIDLLACVDDFAPRMDLRKYSVYRYGRLRELWKEGNPFAWHLHLESRLIFSSDSTDYLCELGVPARYTGWDKDCVKFKTLFDRSYHELQESTNSATFNLSCMFLSIRNFATCHSLALGIPTFSRQSPLIVKPALSIDAQAFSIMMRARLLSTRGYGENLSRKEIATTIEAAAVVPKWMARLRSQQSS